MEWVGPFMLRKYLVYAVVGPSVVLIRSSGPVRRWCGGRFSYRVGTVDLAVWVSQFEVAVVLGAFVPLLLPVAALGFAANQWTLRCAAARHTVVFVPNDAPRPLFPLWYLFLSPVVLCTLAYVFFLEVHPAYSPVALATLVASALAPILLALLCGRREAQKVPSSPVPTWGSAPYEQLPSLERSGGRGSLN